ncbi:MULTISPECIES: DMT family transporter [unclassified Beijerinckia]|uniref:DMT family transporter n=1 Tax=unclassified Beijerinckia TaxID=2638183 RepID=UPI00089B5686|nr:MULTISPECIES: DMT family transporter [unclassified Beijerinckia]MDH7794867.1 drug/metabolite transporter (DMT)-like permease [Beijerinckia sp. GAS462]SEB78384.1 Permease of the drug/metabolite transporter (DMT) superfamily [Beijerinckia sp. 28-YEA-48]
MTAQTDDQTTQAVAPSLWWRIVTSPYLLLALAGLFWSGNHIAGKAGAGHIPPVTMASGRWLLGALILWPFVRRQVIADWPLIRKNWKIVVPLCVFGGGVFTTLQYVALNYTSALNASIFNSFAPPMIAAAGAILFRDRLAAINCLGIAVSFIGVMIIVSRGSLDVLQSVQFNWGDIILVANMGIWAAYCTCLRLRPPVHPMTFVFFVAFLGGLAMAPFAIWEHMRGLQIQFTWLTFGIMTYITLFSGTLAYVFWNRGQEAIGASRAAVFLHLIPFYGAVLATSLLGEHLRWFHIVGCALILVGVWVASRDNKAA